MIEFPEKLRPLFQPARYKVLHGGRGGAKSWGAARALLIQGAQQPLRILCARETQNSISQSVHQLLADQIADMKLDGFYGVFESEIRGKNGTLFSFAGLRQQGVANLKSFEGVDRCWCEEAQAITKKSWDVLIPTIRKPGSEIWITFNPELDTDETYVRFVLDPPEAAQVIQLNWYDNPWFPAELEKERQAMQRRDPEGYLTTWEGKCRAAVEGAIYAREIQATQEAGRVRPVPYDPMLPVHTVWDLGWNDAMTIIMVQRVGGSEIRVLDYIEDSHKTLAEYVALLNQRGYVYGTDFLPHDGAARSVQTGKSAQEILTGLHRRVQIIPVSDIEEGIKAARLMFPRVFFDKEKAKELLSALKRYKRAVHQTTLEPGAPLHDSASHGADAFRYLALSADQMTSSTEQRLSYGSLGII